jgi:hypothetical protein
MGLMVGGGGHPNLLDDGCRYLGTPTPSNGKASCSTERFAGPGGERARISPFSPSAMSAAGADPRLTLPERAYAVPSDRAVVTVVEDHFPRYRADQAFIPPEHPGHAQTWGKLGGLGLSVSVWPAGGTPACGRGGSCLARRGFGTDDPTTVFVGAWDHEDLGDSYPRNSRASQREFVYVGPRHPVVVRESRLVKADEESLGADLDQRLIDFLLDPRLQ